MRFSLILIGCLLLQKLSAQVYQDDNGIQLTDKTYIETVKTVTFRPASNQAGLPIIRFAGPDRLVLDFDDLAPDFTNFQYTVQHCTHDWQPSDLLKAEYLAGMHDYFFKNYDFSINTWVPYTHYQLSIPNENLRLTKSGNYVLIVYRNDDPRDVVLTRRFMVYEERVNVAGQVLRATRLEERDTHQQLNLVLSHAGYEIPNPFIDLHVTIMQNGRYDNALYDMKPKFMKNYELTYNFEGENTFLGGNEFRAFDTKQLTELTQFVGKTVLEDIYNVYLLPEIPRNSLKYSFNFDINGRFVIRRLNSVNPNSEGDYAWIDFFLRAETYQEGNVYVFGQLSDWKVKEDFKMHYDFDAQAYRAKILLKQGYYNYQYVVKKHSDDTIDETLIEGSHWETGNEYTILVYHRELGIRYDRLVGYNKLEDPPGYAR